MAVRPLRHFGDPVLRTPCVRVTLFDPTLRSLVDDLMDSVRLPGRAGLAANQIGVGLAVFSYDVDGHLGYLVNPRIVERSGDLGGREACLSLPGASGAPTRSSYVRVLGADRDGTPVSVEGTGEFARCLQHETDHLDGMLYVDRLERAAQREVYRALRARQVIDGSA